MGFYLKDIKNKEYSADQNIILVVRYDRRDNPKSNLKIDTKWKDIIYIFDDKNLSVKKPRF